MKKFNPQNQKKIKIINKIISLFFHKRNCKNYEKICLDKAKRILIVDFALIGDTIMLIPFLRVLKKNALNAKIDLVCDNCGKEIFDDQELINNYFLLSIKKISTAKSIIKNILEIIQLIFKIRNINYDIIIEPRGDLRYILFMYFCKGKRKISLNYTGGECLLTDVVIPSGSIEHLVDDKLYILKKLGCKINKNERIPYLIASEETKRFQREYKNHFRINNKLVIGIHPSASIAIKEWKRYDLLIEKINSQYINTFFIIFKGPGEDNHVNQIINYIKNINIQYKISQTNLSDYKKILGLCDMVICNDSGAGHISASYGVATVVIMGPFMPEFCAPLGRHVFPVSKNLDCKPCLSKKCKFGNDDIRCLNRITVEDVMQKVDYVLNTMYIHK